VSDDIDGLDGTTINGIGTIGGRRVGEGGAPGSVGTLMSGRSANDHNLRQARKVWPEADARDFADLPDGSGWYDRATGQAYELLGSDPMFSEHGRELCDVFTVASGRILFLRKRDGVTLDTVERSLVEQARRAEQAADQGRRFRERQPKRPVLLSDAYPGDRYAITLRDAARLVLDAAGTIERGDHGELRVLVPALLAGEPMLEKDARQPLIAASEVLVTAYRVVLAEIDRADGDRGARKQRLDERLPDRQVTLGGGVA
jgi:hypothetical protein